MANLSALQWYHGVGEDGPRAESKLASLGDLVVSLGFGGSPWYSNDGGLTWALAEAQDDTEYLIVPRQLAAKVGSAIVGAFNTGYGFRPCTTVNGIDWTVMAHTAASNNVYDAVGADWFADFITFFTGSGTTSRCDRSTDFTTWDTGQTVDHGWIDKMSDTMCVGGSKMVHTVTWQDPFRLKRPAFSTDGGENWTLSSYGSALTTAASARPNATRFLWIEDADRFLQPVDAIYSDDLDAWSSFTPPFGTVHCGFHWDGRAVVVAESGGRYELWETANATDWTRVTVMPDTVTGNIQYAHVIDDQRVAFVTSTQEVLRLGPAPRYFWTNPVNAYEVP